MSKINLLLLALLLVLIPVQLVLAEGNDVSTGTKGVNQLAPECQDPPADTDEGKDGESDESDSERAEKASSGDTTVLSDWLLLVDVGGMWKKTTNRGGETWQESWALFGGATVRAHVGNFNLDRPVRLDLGLHLEGDFSEFESEGQLKYEGDGGEFAGGLEFFFQDTYEGGKLPRFSLELRALWGYAKIRGSNEDRSYDCDIETAYFKFSGILSLLWPFADEGDELIPTAANFRICDIYGVEVGVNEGFTPKIELRWDWKIPMHVSKRSTTTRAGGSDRAYESRFHMEVRWHLWRHATDTINAKEKALWEVSYGPMYGLTWQKSSGLVTKYDGHSIYEHEVGGFLEVMFNRSIGLNLYVTTTFGVADERAVRLGADVSIINF